MEGIHRLPVNRIGMPSFLAHLRPRHRTLRLSLLGKVFGIAAAAHVSDDDTFFREQV
jgi:hypothetical protein